MPWREEAKTLFAQNPVNTPWKSISEKLSSKYGQSVTIDAVRGVCRRMWQPNSSCDEVKSLVAAPAKSQTQPSEISIIELLSKGKTAKELCDLCKTSERIVRAMIEDSRESGWDIVEENGVFFINKQGGKIDNHISENWNGERIIKFGIVSDTHLCSNSQQLTHLNTFYDRLAAEEIETVYHSGDIVDGDDIYPGHKFEVFKLGADNQKQYAVDKYPKRSGVTTKFITGNHDLKYYQKMGYDIGDAIAKDRSDMLYLGQYFARIDITPRCTIQLEHPLGKPAYAVSYKTQRKIDNMRGGDKPNILVEGHYHYSAYLFRRNVHAICCPSFQGPTKFSKRLGLESDNGAFIIELKVDKEGSVSEFTPRFYPFYVLANNDY